MPRHLGMKGLRDRLFLMEVASDYDEIRELALEAAAIARGLDGASADSTRKARLLSPTELAELPPPHYLIRDLVRAAGLNVLYGPSGSGKTIYALDLSLCIATDLAWFGQEVEQGLVVYVVAEGAFGLHPRVDAWQRSRGVKTIKSFRVFPEAVNLYRGEVEPLVAAIDELDQAPALLVFDTVARCMVGGDENSARDTGLVIDHVDALRARYSAAAMLIHHTGKNGELERGSSAFRGAADTMVSLKPDGAGLKLKCEKQKDAADFEPWHLHLAAVGDSVSLRPGMVAGQVAPQEAQILESVSASFGTDWVSASKVEVVSEVPRASVYRGLKSLVRANLMEERPVNRQRKEYRVTFDGMALVSSRLNSSHETSSDCLVSHPSLEGETNEEARR